MSMRPYFFDYETPRWPNRLMDQNFGLTLLPNDLIAAATSPLASPLPSQYRPWWPKEAVASMKVDQDKFNLNVDVQHFSPDEIVVKIVDGNVVVEGKHEEKKDEHGFISRQFSRRFKLPEGVKPETVESRLSSDGVLSIVAPIRNDIADEGVRSVPITPTGPIRRDHCDIQN